VHVTIDRGEIVALAGENGSGKSTFAKLIAGLTPATAGTIEVDGEPLPSGRPAQAARAGVGIVPQEVTGMGDLSVAENILLPVHHSLLSIQRRRRNKALVRPLLDRLGVAVDLDAPFRSLPAGTAVLVELARALVIRPKLLIVDETTAYLERGAADRLLDLLRSIRDDGVSVVFISHRLREVHELADRTVVLRDGRLVGELSQQDATPDRIARMMVGREIEAHQRGQTQAGAAARLAVDGVSLTGTSAPVSLHVRPGEVVGLAGLVNSGCVALLDHISGARTLPGGTVSVDGKPVSGGLHGALAARIVMLPGDRQREGLLRDASMRSNIMLGAWPLLSRVSPRQEARITNRFIADFGIRPNDPEQHLRLLSGGNQQKVMLARALRREPLVLLLNEPTRGVDIGARADVYGVVANSLREGISVLFYSTDMHELMELSDRVLVCYDNELVAELTGDQITEDNISRHMGGGR
jgi:ribose transport system ATP-binding protein